MPRRQIRTVSLSRELDRFVVHEAASGHYSTASEVIRAGGRTLIQRRAGDYPFPSDARQG